MLDWLCPAQCTGHFSPPGCRWLPLPSHCLSPLPEDTTGPLQAQTGAQATSITHTLSTLAPPPSPPPHPSQGFPGLRNNEGRGLQGSLNSCQCTPPTGVLSRAWDVFRPQNLRTRLLGEAGPWQRNREHPRRGLAPLQADKEWGMEVLVCLVFVNYTLWSRRLALPSQ